MSFTRLRSDQNVGGKRGTFSTTSTTLVTALSVNGPGTLCGVYLSNSAAAAGTQIKVTIDGNVIVDYNYASGITSKVYLNPLDLTSSSSMSFNLKFKQSLLIELKAANGVTATTVFVYEQ